MTERNIWTPTKTSGRDKSSRKRGIGATSIYGARLYRASFPELIILSSVARYRTFVLNMPKDDFLLVSCIVHMHACSLVFWRGRGDRVVDWKRGEKIEFTSRNLIPLDGTSFISPSQLLALSSNISSVNNWSWNCARNTWCFNAWIKNTAWKKSHVFTMNFKWIS